MSKSTLRILAVIALVLMVGLALVGIFTPHDTLPALKYTAVAAAFVSGIAMITLFAKAGL